MKKILFILPSLGGGGLERVVLHLCQHLNKNKFEITLALLKKRGDYIDFLPLNIQVIDLKISRIRYSLFPMIRLLKQVCPDIVFSSAIDLNMLGCFLKPFFVNLKFIIRESNIVSLLFHSKLKKYLYRLCIKNADFIVAQSDDMRNDLVRNFGCKEIKIKKINNPVDISFIEDKIFEPLDFSFMIDKKVLLAVGRMEYQKGFDILIDAFSQLTNRENYQLVIMGKGRLKQQLEDQVKMYRIEHLVYFAGFDVNPYKYMAKADFLISSSRFEGFPNVVIEALACGTPVIANLYPGGINEIINESVGSIIDISNKESFDNALLKKYDSQKIKDYCRSKYSIETIIEQYEWIFDNQV